MEEVSTSTGRIAPKKKKKKNPIVSYFTPFGLKQVRDLLMIVGALLIFVGLFLHGFLAVNIVAVIGMIMYGVASLIAIYECICILTKKGVNKKNAEFKSAIINLVIMVIILGLAVLGIVAAFSWI